MRTSRKANVKTEFQTEVKPDFKLKSRVKVKYQPGESLTAVTGGIMEKCRVTPLPIIMIKPYRLKSRFRIQ